MLRKRKGLLAILLVLSILLLVPLSLTRAGSSDTGTETPLPEPDITHLQGPAPEQAEPDPLPLLGLGASPCKKVLFLDDRDGNEFSVLKDTLIGLGFEVEEVLPSEITASLIAPYDVVVFSLGWYAGGGGQREITDAEAATLVQFVNSGKSLFLVGELGRTSWSGKWRRSLNRIAGNFGIKFQNNLLCSSASHLSNPSDPDGGIDLPIINEFQSRLLSEGVGQFSLFWGSSVGAKSPARAVARSDASSFRDADCTWNFMISEWECAQDPNEPAGKYPVLVAAESGAGRILAIGDSSWLMNGWIDYTGNKQLAKNVFAWLARLPSVKSLTARPTQGTAPLRVSLTCKTKDPGTHVQEVQWVFGDGTADTTTTDNNTAVINHVYSAAGTFAATCTVVDTSGCSSTSNPATITVAANRPPVIDAFTADNQTGIESLLVHFTCSAHDPDRRGSIVNYLFTFGDGNTTSSATGSAANLYGVGSFNATCTAVDNRGAQTTSSPLAITVLPNQAPVIDSFTADNQTGLRPLDVDFLCSAHDPDGVISYYRIDFGDGNTTISTAGDAYKLYWVPGAFNATCTAVDNRGAETTSSPLAINVYEPPIITNYTAIEQLNECDNTTHTRPFSFTCSASDPDGLIIGYEIEFGDNQTYPVTTSDTSITVLHSYEYEEINTHSTSCTVFAEYGWTSHSAPVEVQVHSCR